MKTLHPPKRELHKVIFWGTIFWCLLVSASCSKIKPDLMEKDLKNQLPEKWVNRIDNRGTNKLQNLMDIFKNPALENYLQEAIKNNFDLKSAFEHLKAAGYLAKGKIGELLPYIDLEIAHPRHNQDIDPITGQKATSKLLKAGVNLSWEIDIWGKTANEYSAGKLKYLADSRDYQKLKDSLAAKIIELWIQTTASALVKKNRKSQLKIVEQINERFQSKYTKGLLPYHLLLDIRKKREELLSELTEVEEQYQRNRRTLEILGGRKPEASIFTGFSLPEIDIIQALPGEVIRKRPDIQGFLLKFKSTKFLTKAAGKRLLPSLKITGYAGKEGKNLKILRGADIIWSLISSLTQPLFAGGRLLAEYKAQKAEARSALWEFEGAVIKALKEVEDALGREKELFQRVNISQNYIKLSSQKRRYQKNRYIQGLEDSTEYLLSSLETLDAKNQLNQLKAWLLINRVELALASGLGVLKEGAKKK